MGVETSQKGIGAALHINGETKAMRDFFSVIRNAGIQTIDPLDAHVTIVDRAETQISVFSERDQLSLNRARSKATEYLATLPYYELVLSPAEPRLEAFGRRLAVVIAEEGFLRSVRDYIGQIFKEEANISLSNRSYLPHMSVGMKTRGLGAAAKKVNNQRIPRRLHVVGHDVSERVFNEDPSRLRSSQSYINKPAARLHSVS